MIEITSEIVRELLHYDPDTGVFTWRTRSRERFATDRNCNKWNTRYAGKKAGSLFVRKSTGYRYWRIGLFNRDQIAHRLVWLYMSDDPLPEQIDHINRDATDNRWCNLRASDSSGNMLNLSMHRSNTSGVTGVTWHVEGRKWMARCTVNKKGHYLGLYRNIEDAAAATRAFYARNGFDAGHGAAHPHYAT